MDRMVNHVVLDITASHFDITASHFDIAASHFDIARFGECNFENDTRIPYGEFNITNKTNCLDAIADGHNFTWHVHPINFDHVFLAYLSLLQVVSAVRACTSNSRAYIVPCSSLNIPDICNMCVWE